MADLQGPKIRVGKFADGKVELEPGQRFVLDAELKIGDATQVGLDYKELPRDVAPGAILLLNDGLIRLVVEAVDGPRIVTRVVLGGIAVEQQGHQPPGRRPHGARADGQGHGRREDGGRAQGRLPRGVVPEEQGRHVHGAPAAARGGRPGAGDREDRARRGDRRAGGNHRRLRRHHGRARRPRRRGRQCGGARPAEADDPHGARAQQARRSPRRR